MPKPGKRKTLQSAKIATVHLRRIYGAAIDSIRPAVYNDKKEIIVRRIDKMLEYISAPEAAKKWGISERRVQKLCEENRIPGVAKFSRMWLIPKGVEKPADGRRKERKQK